MVTGALALAFGGFVLGLRHGVDWDHIAAITDITNSVVTTEEATEHMVALSAGGAAAAFPGKRSGTRWHETRWGFGLATLYALGHASVVIALGLLAIWAGTILPAWIDPIMEAVVVQRWCSLATGFFIHCGGTDGGFGCKAGGCSCSRWWGRPRKPLSTASAANLRPIGTIMRLISPNTVRKQRLVLA